MATLAVPPARSTRTEQGETKDGLAPARTMSSCFQEAGWVATERVTEAVDKAPFQRILSGLQVPSRNAQDGFGRPVCDLLSLVPG